MSRPGRPTRPVGVRAPWALPLLAVLLGLGAAALLLEIGGLRLPPAAVLVWAVLLVVAAALTWWLGRRRQAADRTVAQSQERLRQAQKMDAVGRLAGGIAHDINNYLAGIRTHCELLLAAARRGALDAEATARRLEAIIATVLKASSLIERLLTFGRRQAGRPEVVDLNEVVETFAAGLGGGLGRGVTLETRLEPGLWPVEIDLSQVEQALANLVVNARDALAAARTGATGGGPGDGRIVVTTANVPADTARPSGAGSGTSRRERVALTVSDDGPGIPPAIRDQVFDPFFTTKETTGASGLGLATVYAVVEEAGGTIEIDSRTAGEPADGSSIIGGGGIGGAGGGRELPGTTVRILLPRAAPHSPSRSTRSTRSARSAGRGGAGKGSAETATGGERILLVDDEPEVRLATRELLSASGYRVEAVTAPEEALAAAAVAREEGAPFALVVTDVRLGAQAGPDLVARLREQGPVRALYMSGYTDRIALRTGPGRGDAFFLKKPFSGDGLLRMVRELLDEPAP